MNYEQAMKLIEEVRKIPYPEIGIIPKDITYADMLLNDFAGNESELTAITLYCYQHLTIKGKDEDVNRIMLEISKVEMKHLNLIGVLINKLGLDPCYTNSLGKNWTSDNIVYYKEDVVKIMQYNIECENKAIQHYVKDRNYTNNKNIQAIFERIILDEKSHIEIFEGIKQAYMQSK